MQVSPRAAVLAPEPVADGAPGESHAGDDSIDGGAAGDTDPAGGRGGEGDAPLAEDAEPVADGRLGPGADLTDEELLRRVAALLFASPDPLSVPRLVELLERPERARVQAALAGLEQRLASAGLPLQVRAIRGGHTLMTAPEVSETVARLVKGHAIERVSPAALETLAVIAYRQPVTKAEIEAIRGVQAGPVLRSLVDRGLVRVLGRADVPGHPLQYGTTQEFLDRFGLMSLDALPRDSELARG